MVCQGFTSCGELKEKERTGGLIGRHDRVRINIILFLILRDRMSADNKKQKDKRETYCVKQAGKLKKDRGFVNAGLTMASHKAVEYAAKTLHTSKEDSCAK